MAFIKKGVKNLEDNRKTLKELEEEWSAETAQYGYEIYRPTNAKCSKCGHQLYINDSVTLTCYPPMYQYICKDCGNVENSFVHL